ncbi:hypothetical protein DL546_004128 [Coniochaeta pulveracea]|uniref:Uncharacterized protein n=1 Tax=Coniochaeta pulveracea TaxID=177199 RepID=A0A420Y3K6_9PEZI|nr:hypothetical protein DL546_004128 [Coniochaeta pulveracea]
MSSTNQSTNQATADDASPNDYKTQLDKRAEGTIKKAVEDSEQKSEGLLDKVSEYVPVVGKLLGKEEKKPEPKLEEVKPSGPPLRPHHDTQIEEFVRDQHRSKAIKDDKE